MQFFCYQKIQFENRSQKNGISKISKLISTLFSISWKNNVFIKFTDYLEILEIVNRCLRYFFLFAKKRKFHNFYTFSFFFWSKKCSLKNFKIQFEISIFTILYLSKITIWKFQSKLKFCLSKKRIWKFQSFSKIAILKFQINFNSLSQNTIWKFQIELIKIIKTKILWKK